MLQLASGEGVPTLQLLPNQTKTVLSKGQWVKAWNRYVASGPDLTEAAGHPRFGQPHGDGDVYGGKEGKLGVLRREL